MKKTMVAALAAALLLAGSSYLAGSIILSPARLHIQAVRITNTECGKPLEFQIIVKNTGGMAFNGKLAVLISIPGNHIGHEFTASIPAGGVYVDKQSSPNADFLADCCKKVCFTVTLAANLQNLELPVWDKVPYKICTRPGNVVVVSPVVALVAG